ncbi:MAG: hypothetical protein WC657_07765 [Candidatus Paceibacterota bacterium]|jgi:hypothetical protein
MISTILTLLIVGLPKVGYFALLYLWWTCRKQKNLSCIPWILLAFILGSAAQTAYTILTKSHHAVVVFHPYVFTMPNISVYVRVIGSGIAEFICVFMIACNIAFLTHAPASALLLQAF